MGGGGASCLIGVDYLSVQIFQGDPQTHIALLQAES